MLKGLIDYLDDYCNVYFIDLPGFTKKVPRLSKITFENYAKYVDRKIKSLNIKYYIIGGISFGFDVINQAKLDKRCKGIVGIEPYLDTNSLNMGFIERLLFKEVSDFVIRFNLYSEIWKSNLMKRLLNNKHIHNTDMVLGQIDPVTFFQTAHLIFNKKTKPKFHNLPYILLINMHDHTIKSDYAARFFNNANKHLILYDDIDHYPKDLSKAYFKKKIPKKTLIRAVNFINKK